MPAQAGVVLVCYHFSEVITAGLVSLQQPPLVISHLALHKHLQPLHPCSAPQGNNFSPKENPCKSHFRSVLQACAQSGEGAHRVHCSHVAVTEARKGKKGGARPQRSPKGRAPSWAPTSPWAWQVAGWWLQLHLALGSLSWFRDSGGAPRSQKKFRSLLREQRGCWWKGRGKDHLQGALRQGRVWVEGTWRGQRGCLPALRDEAVCQGATNHCETQS